MLLYANTKGSEFLQRLNKLCRSFSFTQSVHQVHAFLFTGTPSLICLLSSSSFQGLVLVNAYISFLTPVSPSWDSKDLWAASAEWELPECQALLLGDLGSTREPAGYRSKVPDASLTASEAKLLLEACRWNGIESDSEYLLRLREKRLIGGVGQWRVEGVNKKDDGRETLGFGWITPIFLDRISLFSGSSPTSSFGFDEHPGFSLMLISLLLSFFLLLARASSSFISRL